MSIPGPSTRSGLSGVQPLLDALSAVSDGEDGDDRELDLLRDLADAVSATIAQPITRRFTPEEAQAAAVDGALSAIVAVPLDTLVWGDIETLNDFVCAAIIGSVQFLDITYTVVGGDPTSNSVLIEATGDITDWLAEHLERSPNTADNTTNTTASTPEDND